mmetsp:Transcript_53672/g.117339  ORF Transcript_53672/g.117339 Transcript_53672/m.117339 type:complete len:254 (-) Transcript_53672:510-1271(-)
MLIAALHAEDGRYHSRSADAFPWRCIGPPFLGCLDELFTLYRIRQFLEARRSHGHQAHCAHGRCQPIRGCGHRSVWDCSSFVLPHVHWGLLSRHCTVTPAAIEPVQRNLDRHHLGSRGVATLLTSRSLGPATCLCPECPRHLPHRSGCGPQSSQLRSYREPPGPGSRLAVGLVEIRPVRHASVLQHRPVLLCRPHQCSAGGHFPEGGGWRKHLASLSVLCLHRIGFLPAHGPCWLRLISRLHGTGLHLELPQR